MNECSLLFVTNQCTIFLVSSQAKKPVLNYFFKSRHFACFNNGPSFTKVKTLFSFCFFLGYFVVGEVFSLLFGGEKRGREGPENSLLLLLPPTGWYVPHKAVPSPLSPLLFTLQGGCLRLLGIPERTQSQTYPSAAN